MSYSEFILKSFSKLSHDLIELEGLHEKKDENKMNIEPATTSGGSTIKKIDKLNKLLDNMATLDFCSLTGKKKKKKKKSKKEQKF